MVPFLVRYLTRLSDLGGQPWPDQPPPKEDYSWDRSENPEWGGKPPEQGRTVDALCWEPSLFSGRCLCLTWSKTRIHSKEEFEGKLLSVLPVGARCLGGRELHEDGTASYRVLFYFAEKVHCGDAAVKFSIDGNTRPVYCEKPKARQRMIDFLRNSSLYCSEKGDTFGHID